MNEGFFLGGFPTSGAPITYFRGTIKENCKLTAAAHGLLLSGLSFIYNQEKMQQRVRSEAEQLREDGENAVKNTA